MEAGVARIDRRPGDRVVERQPAEDQPREAARLQVTVQSGAGHAVVLAERRIGIDAPVKALAHDDFGLAGVELGMELSARRALYAMVRPKGLRPVGELHRAERRAA